MSHFITVSAQCIGWQIANEPFAIYGGHCNVMVNHAID